MAMDRVHPLRKLYAQLQKQLSIDEVLTVKNLLVGHQMNKDEAEKRKSAMDIFMYLEDHGYISERKLTLLIEFFEIIDRPHLKDMVRGFEETHGMFLPPTATPAKIGQPRRHTTSDIQPSERQNHYDFQAKLELENRCMEPSTLPPIAGSSTDDDLSLQKTKCDILLDAAKRIFEFEFQEIKKGNGPDKSKLLQEAFRRFQVTLEEIKLSSVILTLRTRCLSDVQRVKAGLESGEMERSLSEIMISKQMQILVETQGLQLHVAIRVDPYQLAKGEQYFKDLRSEHEIFAAARERRIQVNLPSLPFVNQLNVKSTTWPTRDEILDFRKMFDMVIMFCKAFRERVNKKMAQQLGIDRSKIADLEQTKSMYEERIKQLQSAKEKAEQVAVREKTKRSSTFETGGSQKRQKVEDEGPVNCEGCKERQAVHRCAECRLILCSKCTSRHEHMEISKGQSDVRLDKYLSEELSKKSDVYCNFHPENEVHLFCESCQESICPDCIATHPIPDHVHRNLQEAADTYREQLKKMVKRLKIDGYAAKSLDTGKTFTKDQLDTYWQEEAVKVKNKAKAITQRVEKEEFTLLNTLRLEYEMITQAMESDLNEWEERHGNIEQACHDIEALLHHSNAKLLSSKRETVSNIQEYVHRMDQLKTTELIKFQPSYDLPEHGVLGFLKFDVSASFCTVENLPTRLVRGESVNAKVRIADGRGNLVISCKQIKAKIWKEDGSSQDLTVLDDKDGTHIMKITADVGGMHKVTVELGDQPIPGSPFFISIKGLVKTIGRGKLHQPKGIAINKRGDFAIADKGNVRIYLTDRDGNYKSRLAFSQFKKPFAPLDVAISADGDYFMTDTLNKQVVVSDENKQSVRCFGQGQLKYVHGIAISPVDGSVYVTDWDGKGDDTEKEGSHCVRRFTQDGVHIQSFGKYGRKSGEFIGPGYVVINNQGQAFVTDMPNNRVQVFSPDCEFLYSFNTDDTDDSDDFPSGIAIDDDGFVYVCDKINECVLKLDSKGRVVASIDSGEEGLDCPAGVALTNDSPCRVAVVDYGGVSVKVFAQ
ncbi:tripartite motif-containing protein 2-like [Ptychodera flava]|uniref:tripartite motif-containing protein 2-like n=1 Tax=Ptychodera flava TaxID=63121 RepID=UPI00396A7109